MHEGRDAVILDENVGIFFQHHSTVVKAQGSGGIYEYALD